MEKYDEIGTQYNVTRKADPVLAANLVEHMQPSTGWNLDIGCGTGNYTKMLVNAGFRMVGIDPSEIMLEKARSNSSIQFLKGSAEKIEFESNHFDNVVATLTIHHWKALKTGFEEVYRVLKPGGRLVIFTSTPSQMRGYWLNHYWASIMAKSCEQMPGKEYVKSALNDCGFARITTIPYEVHYGLQDLFLYSAKSTPERYLDPKFRRGISSFSSLANKEEIELGLTVLSDDIASGKIHDVIKQYENSKGDYMYIIASKSL